MIKSTLYTNAFPPSTWNTKRLQIASRFLVRVVLVLLARGTGSNVLKHILSKAFPPIQPVYSLLSLGDTQMTTVRAVMQVFLSFWKSYNKRMVMIPKALLLRTFALLSWCQLVNPSRVTLIPLQHSLLKCCQCLPPGKCSKPYAVHT